MIRGHGYLKYLKLFSIGFGISFFMGLGANSVNGEWIIHPNGQYFVSQLDNTMQLNVNNKGQLMSQRFGYTSRMLAFASSENNRIYFMRGENQKPYFFITTRDVQAQGYLKSFSICSGSGPEFTGGFNDCSSYNIDDSFATIVGGLFQSMTINDYWGFNISSWNCYPYGNVLTNQIAFSSSEYNRTILFGVGFGNTEHCVVNQPNNLTGSVGFSQTMDYSAIPTSFLTNPPGFVFAGDSNGSVDSSIDTVATGDTSDLTCTWGDVLTVLETEGYNKYVCYGGLDNFDLYDSSLSYNPIAGQGLSIDDIRAWSGSRAWDTFQDWFFFWNGIYKDTSDNNYNAMWESYPAVYKTYFQLYNSYKGGALDPRTVLEYCQLRTFSGSLLNNSAGGYFRPVCETVINEKQTGVWSSRLDGTIYSGGVYTGDTPVATNWNGVGTLSGIDEQKGAVNFIQDFFNKAKSVIPTNYPGTGGGMLPSYIIMFMLALILFRFLSH